MKIEGNICEVRRTVEFRDGKEVVFARAKVRMASPSVGIIHVESELWLAGFEPEANFVLGRKIIILVEDV